MSTTPTPTTALQMEYSKVIVARFVTKRDGSPMHCVTCNAVLVQGTAYAAVATGSKAWHSYCPACAADCAVQIRGLFVRITELGAAIPQPVQDMVRDFLGAESRATFLLAKQALMTLRGEAGREVATERAANGLDLSSVPSGRYAVPGGDTRLKVKIDNVATGKWAGWTFVSDAAEYGKGKRYGNQKPGATYRGEIEAELRAIAADPQAAMAAYGHLTSTCGICGRPLEDADSVARGIGPICAARFGG
jgi:hypothetical protein